MNLTQAKALLGKQSVHPYAARFPLLEDAELRDLAADIKANGLIHPIVRDEAWHLIDGRNRFVACALAGVEPRWLPLPDDTEPMRFIFAVNVRRRHLTPGARAMAAAMTLEAGADCDVADGRRNVQKVITEQAGATAQMVSMAIVVLAHAKEYTDAILAGGSLKDAYLNYAKPRQDAAVLRRSTLDKIRWRHVGIYRRLQAGEIDDDRAIFEADAIEAAELDARIEAEQRERVRKLATEAFPEQPLPRLRDLAPAAERDDTVAALGARAANREAQVVALNDEVAFATSLLNVKESLLAVAEAGIPDSAADWMGSPAHYVTSWAADVIAGLNVLIDAAQAARKQGSALRKVQ
jgi:formiminotetrahydrofolate cyclodeaminase